MKKQWICLLLIAALCTGLTGCGKQSEDATPTNGSTETATVSAKDDADKEDDEEEDDDDDTPIDEASLTVKGKNTTASKESTSDKTTPTAASTETDKNGSAKTTTTSNKSSTSDKSGASDTSKSANAKSTSPSGAKTTNTAATEPPTDPPAEAPQEILTDPAPEPDAPEEKTVSGIIYLDDGYFEGEGITVDGGTIRITGEGTYILSGNRTGMVEVNTTKKVKLKLNGVSINNPYGPAILCTDAKKLTITLIEGTYNSLTDGYSDLYDGAICSNDTLEIKGAGTLDINATNQHGIASDDDIIIKNGTITVNAVKTGMMANDDITISGGNLRVTGATNGIKSKGTLHISGGTLITFGGKETKSALSSAGAFSLTGGYVYAIGCGVSAPDVGSSTQCAITATLSPSLGAGSTASFVCDGMQFMYQTSPYAFNTLFISTPDVHDGMPFSVFGNDVEYGGGFVTAGLLTSVSAELAPVE